MHGYRIAGPLGRQAGEEVRGQAAKAFFQLPARIEIARRMIHAALSFRSGATRAPGRSVAQAGPFVAPAQGCPAVRNP